MKKIWSFIPAVLLPLVGNAQLPSHDEYIKAESFAMPAAAYRSVPFYSLNDLLDTTVIKEQIRAFAEGGCGGVNLHTRTGLLTEYLGPEFCKAIDVAVREAEKNGIYAWFYDEDKWPSGFAGGRVPREHPEYVQQYLSRMDKGVEVDGNAVVYSDDKYNYVVEKSSMGDPWYNGTTYVDLLNDDVVRAFIESTYVPYAERYKSQLGHTALGMFTDEPQITPRAERPNSGLIPYTPKLFETFSRMHGYELSPKLPLLFENEDDYARVRVDFYRTVAHMFEVNFTKQIADFCNANNMLMQGHFKGEEKLNYTTRSSGNHMAMYRHMGIPGMDILGLGLGEFNTPKSISSVANQYGIDWRMSESFGISGHNMNFEDRKWIVDWLANTGINFNVPHLVLYSMKGERKRDFPPTFLQQPYWRYNKIFEDYSARLFYASSTGRYAAQIAVVHPLESGYIDIEPQNFLIGSTRSDKFSDLLYGLQNARFDYELADEQIMSDIGMADGGELNIGQMSYGVVFLPAMETIRESTLKLLEQVHAGGGRIFVYDQYPVYVDGSANDKRIADLKKISRFVATPQDAVGELTAVLERPFEFEGDPHNKIWTSVRRSGDGYIIQLSNISRLDAIEGVLKLNAGSENLALWDPVTGRSYALNADQDGKISMRFAQTQTWFITTGSASREADLGTAYTFRKYEDKTISEIGGQWSGRRVDPNALTLDFARFSIDGGKTFGDREPVIALHKRMEQSGFRKGELIVEYDFESDIGNPACSLVVEQPEMYSSISVNGKKVGGVSDGLFVDHSFKTIPLGNMVIKGRNVVRLALDYRAPVYASYDAYERYGTEVESIYLIGDFAVSAKPSSNPLQTTDRNNSSLIKKPIYSFSGFAICAERDAFDGDLVTEGYPFYAGEFIYENSFEVRKTERKKRYFIVFPEFEAVVLKVGINGTEVPNPIVYHPFEVEVTDLVRRGKNTISVSATNSLRNLMGPHHHKGGETVAVGPQTFSGESTWTSHYEGDDNWYDLRKTNNARIWRDDYYMIPFGLLVSPLFVERTYFTD